MSNGILMASAGMRAQMEVLDILANNLANLNTPGFKQQRSFLSILQQSIRDQDSDANAAEGRNPLFQVGSQPDLQDGVLVSTRRDLDIALSGDGFLAVQTPAGERYTRNGSLTLNERSELCAGDAMPLVGLDGPIVIGPGRLEITAEGEVRVNSTVVGRLKIVTFDRPWDLRPEGHSLLAPPDPNVLPVSSPAILHQGYLEQSNVNAVGSVVEMVSILRRYEALQKSLNALSNDLDAKSIEKLGH